MKRHSHLARAWRKIKVFPLNIKCRERIQPEEIRAARKFLKNSTWNKGQTVTATIKLKNYNKVIEFNDLLEK